MFLIKKYICCQGKFLGNPSLVTIHSMNYLTIQNNVSLTDQNTFGLPWQSRFFCVVDTEKQVALALAFAKQKKTPALVLGGGSNLLPTKKYQGLVIKNEIKGKGIVKETNNFVWVRVGAGEDWHQFVLWSIRNNYFGLENMSLIPGTVGGAVVQNIGAYDVDIQRYITKVEAYKLETGKKKVFERADCQFDYRNSIFKKSDEWMVVGVTMKLPKTFRPVLTYKPLARLKTKKGLTAKQVSQEVCKIRRSKLPDWKKLGTAGSFFGNPRAAQSVVDRLKKSYPDMPVFYNYGSNKATIPAGWLIQHSRLSEKDRQEFLYPKHSLIVVNNHKGSKKQPRNHALRTKNFVMRVQKQVQKDFGITLKPEVRMF